MQASIEGEGEFFLRSRFYKSGHNRNISDKKPRNKKQRGGLAFFGCLFGEAKK
jgi:hypothetical protein